MARLIGTAGHVDHGKTTLIRALTGIDADRLPEEKKRGLTIDIGFAHIELPEVGRVSIVDVPGHERFLHNMLVGALGVDVALLCVSADESVMPQTREHLQILCLLPVQRLVVALTRSDLVDAETQALAVLEVEELLAGTRFAGSPIVPVSAVNATGLDDLRRALAEALQDQDEATDGPWYLPIDRVFTVKGHGAVVTGTLMQGTVRAGDEVEIQPGSLSARIRQIQGHDAQVTTAQKGQRTALNLSGVHHADLRRGMTAGRPGTVFETTCVQIQAEWLVPPRRGARIRLSIGADEVMGRLVVPKDGLSNVTVRLETPTAAVTGQPVIVRRYSPPDLWGGGRVTVPVATIKSRAPAPVARTGSIEEAVVSTVAAHPGGVSTGEVCRSVGRTEQSLGDVFEGLIAAKKLLGFGGLWFTADTMAAARQAFLDSLSALHETHPTLALVPREHVVRQAGLHWSGKPLDRLVASFAEQGLIRFEGTGVSLVGRRAVLQPAQRQLLDRVVAELDAGGSSPPGPGAVADALRVPPQAVDGILKIGISAGEVVRLADGIWFSAAKLQELRDTARTHLQGRSFSASEFREVLGTSRKYAIPLLEYLDSRRVTLRQGETRIFL